MTEWKEYTGSDEQIAELKDALNSYGFITSRISGIRWNKQVIPSEITLNEVFEFATEYLIIPDDPLREMKIRQARTGQPVWYNHKFIKASGECGSFHPAFCQPETYEYSFTEFKEEV